MSTRDRLFGALAIACCSGAPVASWSAVTIESIHVTQAIQTEPFTVPLLADRRMAVRVVAASETTIVAATLRVYVDGSLLDPPGQIDPLNPLPYNPPDDPGLESQQGTVNFELLSSLVPASTDVEITVELEDATGDVATQTSPSLEFISSDCVPELYFMQIDFLPGDPPDPPPLALVEPGVGDAFVRGVFPFIDGTPYQQFPMSLIYREDSGEHGVIDEEDALDLLTTLEDARMSLVKAGIVAADRTYLHGFVGENPIYEWGWAAFPGHVSFGNTEDLFYQRTYAHLLGHNLGLNDRDIDTAIGAPGWDVGARLVDNPPGNEVHGRLKSVELLDFMKGGERTDNAWVRPETYEEITAIFQDCELPDYSDGAVHITGTVAGDAIGKAYMRAVPHLVAIPLPDPVGDFLLNLTDDLGTETAIRFGAKVMADAPGDSARNGFFSVVAPLPPGRLLQSALITNLDGSVVLGGYPQPTQPPQVTIVSPESGATITEPTFIEWEVGDPDTPFPALTTNVAYSWAPGYWIPVAVKLAGPVMTIPFRPQDVPVAHGTGILRVTVSDGLRWAVAEATGLTVDGTTDAPAWEPSPQAMAVAASPNPFGESTLVSFALSNRQSARIQVFDGAGRSVRTLHEGSLAAGIHYFVWDGRTHQGTPAASGIYFVRVQADEQTGEVRVTRLH